MSTLVSVVVPLHNGAAHITQTLASVRAQTHPLVELVVVDDGSTDAGCEAAMQAAPQATFLRNRHAGGVSRARNQGLSVARAPFVCFLDQDDIWHPTHLARQVEAFRRMPQAGAVVAPYHHWYEGEGGFADPASLWPATADDQFDPDFSGWVYHRFMLDCWALTSATMLRREALDDVGAFDSTRPFSEDWELWLRLSRRWPFAKLGPPAVLYRQHATQGSKQARTIDHRTELLLAQAAAFGLASADGRALSQAMFDSTIADYRCRFGLHHLSHGDASVGRRALWGAWLRRPAQLRYLALAAAASAGWRPRRERPAQTAAST